MNILVVHEVSYLKKVVYEYQDFAERLAARGHRVTVVDFDEAGDGSGGVESCSRTGLAPVELVHLPFRNLPAIKYLSARARYRRWLDAKLRARAFDVVLLYSVFVNGTTTVRLCRRYGVPVVFRLLDIYHRIRKSHLAFLPLLLGERYIYRNADAVSPTNQKMARYAERLAGRAGVKRSEIVVHGVDTDFFRPLPRDAALARRYGIAEDDRVALFLGTTYDFSGLDALASEWETVRAACPGARLLIVGGGELDERLRALAAEKGLQGAIIQAGFRPYDEIPRHLSLADCCLNPFRLNEITRDIIPIKILQYLASGKATVATPIPDVVAHFPEQHSGILYQPIDQPRAFAGLVGRLLVDKERRVALGDRARPFVERHFSIQGQIRQLERLLFELGGQPGERAQHGA
jgi:glycosyltransferase involved in cell wall biosynthesis